MLNIRYNFFELFYIQSPMLKKKKKELRFGSNYMHGSIVRCWILANYFAKYIVVQIYLKLIYFRSTYSSLFSLFWINLFQFNQYDHSNSSSSINIDHSNPAHRTCTFDTSNLSFIHSMHPFVSVLLFQIESNDRKQMVKVKFR